ncbi:MAG: MFS transporter [Vulcanimicrobiaceae bacterium]
MRRTVLVSTCLTVMMVQIDTTIVNLGVHAIGSGLAVGVAALQWVVDAYNLTYASLILAGGAIGDRLGRKRIFIAGLAVFTLACIACALAPNVGTLIAARSVAGAGAALAMPGSLAILTDAYRDAKERAQATALWAGFNGVAIAIGPPAGGLLIHLFGWRSIFFLTVPVGGAAIVLAMVAVRAYKPNREVTLDAVSIVLSIVALGALTFGAIEKTGWPYAVAATSVLAFVIRQARIAVPFLPLRFLRLRKFDAALTVAICMTFGMYAFLFGLPRYIQGTLHVDAIVTGWALLPCGICFIAVTPFAARIARHVGACGSIALGMVAIAAALAVAIFVAARGSVALFAIAGGVSGIGMGIATGPLMMLGVSSLPAERSGMASGLMNMARMIGATLGVAVLGGLPVETSMVYAASIELAGVAAAYAFA